MKQQDLPSSTLIPLLVSCRTRQTSFQTKGSREILDLTKEEEGSFGHSKEVPTRVPPTTSSEPYPSSSLKVLPSRPVSPISQDHSVSNPDLSVPVSPVKEFLSLLLKLLRCLERLLPLMII